MANTKLDNLSPEEKMMVAKILKEYSDTGKSDKLNELMNEDWEEIPVDITTFLHDKKYLGNGLIDAEGRYTIFPYWEDKLKEIFPSNTTTAYNTLILTGCLAGDTVIPLLNGNNVKIKDLAEIGDLDEYVYSYDVESNSYVPGHLIKAFSTGIKPVYEIELDNHTIIKATSNHKFMTRDKHWKSIDSGLSVGDSMMPFNRALKPVSVTRKDSTYEYLFNPNKDGTSTEVFTHRLVMKYLFGNYKGVVHHKDFNRYNNDPRNLLLANRELHWKYHAQKGSRIFDEFNKKRREGLLDEDVMRRLHEGGLKGLKTMWDNPENHIKRSKQTTERMNNGLAKYMSDRVWQGPNADKYRESRRETIIEANKKNVERYQINKAIKVSNKAIQKYGELTEDTYEKTKLEENMRTGYPSWNSILKRISSEELYNQAVNYNHKIIRITFIGYEEVYDLTVEKYHNFAIDKGIVAHNSIGIGKTMIGSVCLLYLLYRLLCLKDPYLYYGMQPIDKITISLMNVTIEAAKGVALDKINQLILSSEWFMSHGQMTGITNLEYIPNKHIEFIAGSSNNQVIGRAIFCLSGDTKVCTDTGVYKISTLVNKKSRFLTYTGDDLEYSELCEVKVTGKSKEKYILKLNDGTEIGCTPNHRFLLNNGSYKEAKDLLNTDVLFNNEKIKSINKVILDELEDFYDVIECGEYHNFAIKTNTGIIISHNCNLSDEVNFGLTSDVEKLKKKQKQLISQIDARMRSRFMRGTYLPTLNIIISSKNSEQSFLEDYIENKKKNESITTLIVDEPQWVVDIRKDSPIHFFVAVGNKYLANELLPKNAPKELVQEYRAKGYSMLEVPIGYYESFQDNIDGALTDIAGIATASSLKYISGIRWNEIKTDSYQNPFVKEEIEVGNALDDHSQYYDYFDLTRVPSTLKSKPLYIHLDLSKSGDRTGISGVYVIGKSPKIEGESSTKEMFYQVAFSVGIKAPRGYEISFDKHRAFIRWLKKQGFHIKGISADTYGSAQLAQQLQADGFNFKIISVDRLDSESKIQLQYAYFKSTLYDRRLSVYKDCDLLTEEVLDLERMSDGHIEHKAGGTQGSKDLIDAVVGSLWHASLNADEYAYEYGESLNTMLETNDVSYTDDMSDFENFLKESHKPKYSNPTISPPEDISMGVYEGIMCW